MDTILLVNDSATLTKILSSHFQKAGYQVLAVSGAMEAYEAFIRHEVQLIITDYVLRDKDGFEVIQTFRSKKSHTALPIIVFTAMEEPAVFARCREAGANLVINKTAQTAEMLLKIEALIAEYRASMPRRSLDADLGHCIIKATTEVFRTMMQMKVLPGEASLEKAKTRKAEVIGSIGVAGFLSGSISIFMQKSLAKKAGAAMLMTEPAALTEEELVDAVGELINMIGGNIKTELFQKPPLFDISIPSVYLGEDLQRRTVSNDLCFLVPFSYGGEEFSVEFLMITREKGGTGVQQTLLAARA